MVDVVDCAGAVVSGALSIVVAHDDKERMVVSKTAVRTKYFIVGAPMVWVLDGDKNANGGKRIDSDGDTVDLNCHFAGSLLRTDCATASRYEL